MGEAELGDINSDSNYTFYGAVKNLVRDLLKKFEHDKICFILPLSRFQEDKIIKHGTLAQYRDIIKEICDLNKIDYLCSLKWCLDKSPDRTFARQRNFLLSLFHHKSQTL